MLRFEHDAASMGASQLQHALRRVEALSSDRTLLTRLAPYKRETEPQAKAARLRELVRLWLAQRPSFC
jgi:hypothetical protein